MTKKDAVTLSGNKLSRIWIPLSKKADPRAISSYLGVKDSIVFLGVTIPRPPSLQR